MLFATTDTEIQGCFPALSVLRPHLRQDDFIDRIRCQQQQGYSLAFLGLDGRAVSVAGFRHLEFLAWGKVLYIDNLVTLPEARGKGFGGKLLDEVIAYARAEGCDAVHLDSGFQRHDAHRLYLNHGFRLECHHFARTFKDVEPDTQQ